jgi:predicted Zn-dependent protease
MAFVLALACAGFAAESGETFEVRGEVLPHAAAAVTLQSVPDPFATTSMTGGNGKFRFRDVPAGLYTVSAYVPGRGETRLTIDVGPGTADKKRRVLVTINSEGATLTRESGAVVSARELRIPDSARREYEEASRNVAARDFDGAIAHLEKAVEIEPHFAAAWNHLGTIAYKSQRYDDAATYFRKGIEADPDAYEPVVNLGGVLINLGDLQEAWEYNVQAVLRRPNDPLAQSQLGMTYVAMNKLDLAEKHLLEAAKLDPAHFSHPQLHLAEVYYRKNEYRKAADQIEQFLRVHPDYPTAEKMREAIATWRKQ